MSRSPQAPPPPPSDNPTTLSQALTHKIRELLEQEGWSQREFARRLGVTQGAVSYLLAEKRRASALDYYERLAGIFGLSLSLLVADLEQRIGRAGHTGGRHDTTATAGLNAPAHSSVLDTSVLVRALLETVLDVKLSAAYAYVDAQVQAAIHQRRIEHRGEGTQATRKRRRVATPPERADDHTEGDRAVGADPDPGDALPARRHPLDRDLRRAG